MTETTTDVTALHSYEPDYALPPGDIIDEYLEEHGMTQVELARRLGITPKHMNQVISGAASLSSELAIRLERVTAVPARFWNALEANYQDFQAREREKISLNAEVGLLDLLPIKELIKQGYLADRQHEPIEQLREVLRFFGVAGRSPFDEMVTSAAYRKSRSFTSDQYAIASWLRVGEIQAATVDCGPFDKATFRAALEDIRKLTKIDDPAIWLPQLRDLCVAAGVVVLLVPEIGKTRLSGAARWLTPEKALIQLSLRGKWADAFWFSFFHEAGHLILHSKKQTFIDDGGSSDAVEAEADRFARDLLIPPQYAKRLESLRAVAQVKDFAEEIGVGTGIVAGRLHNDGLVPKNWFNKPEIRPRYDFA